MFFDADVIVVQCSVIGRPCVFACVFNIDVDADAASKTRCDYGLSELEFDLIGKPVSNW